MVGTKLMYVCQYLPIISRDVAYQHLTIGVSKVTIQQKSILAEQVRQVQQGAFGILGRCSNTSCVHEYTLEYKHKRQQQNIIKCINESHKSIYNFFHSLNSTGSNKWDPQLIVKIRAQNCLHEQFCIDL